MEQIIINNHHPRLRLFALWIFILMNLVFRDIHQMTLKSHLDMLLTGYYNGTKITETIMLVGAIIVQIPIGMLLICMMAKQKLTRTLNIVAALLTSAILLTSPPTDMADTLNMIIEYIAIAAIICISIKWKPEPKSIIEHQLNKQI